MELGGSKMNATHEFKAQRIAALRAMADWLEATPEDLPIPAKMESSVYYGMLTDHRGVQHTLDSVIGMALVTNAAGNVDKEVDTNFFRLVKDFGAGVKIEWVAYRNTVCERVVVGTKYVPAEPKQIIEAQPAREEDVIEWKCPSLLKAGASVSMDATAALEAPQQPLLSDGEDFPF
jgi:hypothetical protein